MNKSQQTDTIFNPGVLPKISHLCASKLKHIPGSARLYTIFCLYIVLFFFSLHSNSSAADTAQQTPEKIFIDADYMQANIKTGLSVYTGNVKVKQGDLVLTGDEMTVEQTANEVERITVTGKPAHYNHVTENGEVIKADSEKIVYNASKKNLVLTINAKLQHPDHKISSQKIVYDILTKVAIAGDKSTKLKNGDHRVKITLTPKQDSTTE